MLKKFTGFLAIVLSFVVLFGGVGSALADTTPLTETAPTTTANTASNILGITTIYSTPEQQKKGVTVYKDILKYGVAVPFELPPGFEIPASKKAFNKEVAPKIVESLGDGSVTKAWFDFQEAKAATAGNKLFSVDAPVGEKLYTVVAGKPSQQCPLEIEDTQISFFTKRRNAVEKAQELDKEGYFIYVSPAKALRRKVVTALYDEYRDEKKNAACFLVNGATQKITVDFQDIFNLLPADLQQPAREAPFVFLPKVGKNLYIVNARQTA